MGDILHWSETPATKRLMRAVEAIEAMGAVAAPAATPTDGSPEAIALTRELALLKQENAGLKQAAHNARDRVDALLNTINTRLESEA